MTINDEPTLITNTLGKPAADPSFWALYEDIPPHVRSVLQAAIGDEMARDHVAEAFRSLSAENQQKVREVHQHYMAQQMLDQLRQINGRVGKVERRCDAVMSGESKTGCRHLADAISEFRQGLQQIKLWVIGGLLARLVFPLIVGIGSGIGTALLMALFKK